MPGSQHHIFGTHVFGNLHPLFAVETCRIKQGGGLFSITCNLPGIGTQAEVNEQTQYHWTLFLGQMRIMPMARVCYDKGKISWQIVERLEGLCRDLYKRIELSLIRPSLLHGDLWSGNILFNINGATVIDPAIYFGDQEMELAFILLFDTFGESFLKNYEEVHPLSDDFYDVKLPLYQIYPLLVHVALYGGSYVRQLEQTLKRLKV